MGGEAFAGLHENFPTSEVIREALLRRIQSPGTWLTLGVMLALTLGLLLPRNPKEKLDSEQSAIINTVEWQPDVEKFVLILLVFGLALTVFPEYFYLRDQFGWRMNTIFKFYFQAWILWGIVAAVLSVWLFQSLKKWKGVVFQVI